MYPPYDTTEQRKSICERPDNNGGRGQPKSKNVPPFLHKFIMGGLMKRTKLRQNILFTAHIHIYLRMHGTSKQTKTSSEKKYKKIFTAHYNTMLTCILKVLKSWILWLLSLEWSSRLVVVSREAHGVSCQIIFTARCGRHHGARFRVFELNGGGGNFLSRCKLWRIRNPPRQGSIPILFPLW